MKLPQTLRQWRWMYFSLIFTVVIFGRLGVWR